MPYPIDIKFVLSENQSLITSINQIFDFVQSSLPRYAISKSIDFKARFIITELLTNAIKHAGKTETCLKISIDCEYIRIEKTDFGNPFKLPLTLNGSAESRVRLSGDSFHSMYAIAEGSVVRFICEEYVQTDNPGINEIMEHFGLLIITKSADEFTYQYDNFSGLNTFIVLLKFDRSCCGHL
jgi:anti-sigma regulatory factor (Ser/Thr protein kinase)